MRTHSSPLSIIEIYILIIILSLHLSKDIIINAYDDNTNLYEKNAPPANDETNNKQPLLSILQKAGVPITPLITSLLPPWSNVTNLYGPHPIIYGLETCSPFRAMNSNDPSQILLSPSGLHNTGTTLTRFLLESNCRNVGEISQPFWWKHAPSEWTHKDEYFTMEHKRYPPNTKPERDESNRFIKNILPIVVVKDPLHWMVSMCRAKYGQRWGSETKELCPNLVPSVNTPQWEVKSKLRYGTTLMDGTTWTKRYASLVGLWNSFYLGYFDYAHPRLMVRYEDVLFHPEVVVKAICECAGGVMNEDDEGGFRYHVESVKTNHPSETGLLNALIRYGSDKLRLEGFTEADVDFARHKLNLFLMDKFHYTLPK